MSKKSKKHKSVGTIENKKAAVLGTAKKSRLPLVLSLAAIVIVGGGVIVAMQLKKAGPAPAVSLAGAPPSATASTVAYPLNQFDDGKARHFSYQSGGHTIRYFVLKSYDGVVRAAFDACDVCWPAGKGYYQEGDTMVCRNCGRRFASNRINEVKGGCNPAPLDRSVHDNQLVIRVNDILKGKPYFDFSGRG